jgi:hypothetical protein
MTRPAAALCVLYSLIAAACGSSSTSPAQPTAVTQTNRPPIINSVTVSPSFGISQLTQFSMTASASDPDGDPVTIQWNFGDGSGATGNAFSKTYNSTGVATVFVTATDSKGSSSNDSRTVTVGGMAGTWIGTSISNSLPVFGMGLTQSGGTVVGTFTDGRNTGQVGPTGAPGVITTSGAVTLRIKIAPFSDFTMTGNMEASGRRVTGTISGSGFNGQSFTMDKQ